MNIFHLPIESSQNTFKLDSLTGSLLSFNYQTVKINNSKFPDKLIKAIEECNNPYKLNYEISKITNSIDESPNNCYISLRIIKQLTKHNFFIGYKSASLICPKRFNSTKEAIEYFRRKTQFEDEDTQCLPRSLFAAASSKSFDKNGVIFIGVFFPSNSMHAWIIENREQPDICDTIWTNFQPVAAIC